MQLIYFGSFALAFVISMVATRYVIRLARKGKVIDIPDDKRHFHALPTPTLGGLAVFIGFFLTTFGVGIIGGHLLGGNIPFGELLAIWIGGAILMAGGYLDDRYRLPAKYSIIFPILA